MAAFTPDQVKLLGVAIDEAVSARRRGGSKSSRPEFKMVYDREIAELLQLKPVLEKVNGEGSRK